MYMYVYTYIHVHRVLAGDQYLALFQVCFGIEASLDSSIRIIRDIHPRHGDSIFIKFEEC